MSGERPEEIPEWAWDKACEAMNRAGWHMRSVRIEAAKAILAAVEEEREKIVEEIKVIAEESDSQQFWSTGRALASAIRNRKES